ncbi:kinase-like domain-containing protein [Xylaria sp. FL0043]|nr:kinase-like domain-containing protein [Xylaria sp. FL0043]
MQRVYAKGTFKEVFRGEYLEGENRGRKCVAKIFKDRSTYESWQFDLEMSIINATQRVLDNWLEARVHKGLIRLNKPEIWMNARGRKAMVEPWLQNFKKWNSNSGWYDRSGSISTQIMQALSHFSYHDSQGRLLLCDLQGDMSESGYHILTDPAIMSERQEFGPADLGPRGIKAFFARHQCTPFCGKNWLKPGGLRSTGQEHMRQGTMFLPRRGAAAPA